MSSKSPITSHVLDVAQGRPAKNLTVKLSKKSDTGDWIELADKVTNDDGRVTDFVEGALVPGTYKLTFETGPYLEAATARRAFYPSVDVVFEAEAEMGHYHVPLLLSPFGYSTYRGS